MKKTTKTMDDEELVAIPKSEYERLKRIEETMLQMLDAQIRDCKVKMQMMQFDTMIKQAMPPGSKHI